MFGYLIAVVLSLVFVPIAIGSIIAAPPVPTKKRDVERMIRLAEIGLGDVVYDLGAGYGSLVLEAARNSESTRIVGVELSPVHVLLCKLKVMLADVADRVSIKLGNFYAINLEEADVVLCFLMPEALEKLKSKFKTELRKGARVVSYLYPVPGWDTDFIDVGDEQNIPIFVYHL